MSLSVAYRSEAYEPAAPARALPVKGKSAREIRVGRWMARQYEKDYQEALKEFADDIRLIQQHEPGWMPAKQ
jgi:hypothetical protein